MFDIVILKVTEKILLKIMIHYIKGNIFDSGAQALELAKTYFEALYSIFMFSKNLIFTSFF
jgi:hypothetical protein